jgi:integrative and conjugative element protein (TIGR02256 family)
LWCKKGISINKQPTIDRDIEAIPLIYTSDYQSFTVEFKREILLGIFKKCDIANRVETGGILLGKYSIDSSVAHILDYSGPPSDSQQRGRSFLRGVNGLKALIDRQWKVGQYYLGEWHYHPHSSSTPSQQDIHQMQQIAADPKYKCPEPILLIVGGSTLHGWEINVRTFQKGLNNTICLHRLP